MKSVKKIIKSFTGRPENNKNKESSADNAHQITAKQNELFRNDIRFNMSNVDRFDIETKCIMVAQMFYGKNGYYPDIMNPKTFSEKALWLKLMYEDEQISVCCDKYSVKGYIDLMLGEGHTVPVLKKFDSVFDFNPDELPDKFVLKVSWCTGYNIIVTDKSKINIEEIRAKLDYWRLPWKSSYYGSFNWGYKNVKPTIFAEEYINISKYNTEYKVFCFNGKVRFILVEIDYFGVQPMRGYYDRDWEEEPFQIGNIKKTKVKKPDSCSQMIEIAEKLSEPFPYVRVDFYDLEDKLYVGEMTFYSGGGFSTIEPREYDLELGNDLDISIAMEKMKGNQFSV